MSNYINVINVINVISFLHPPGYSLHGEAARKLWVGYYDVPHTKLTEADTSLVHRLPGTVNKIMIGDQGQLCLEPRDN